MLDNGKSKTEIAKLLTVSRATLRKSLREFAERGDFAFDNHSKPYPVRSNSLQEERIKESPREYTENITYWDQVLYS